MGTACGANCHDGKAVVVLVNCAGGREMTVVRDALTQGLHTPTLLIAPTDHTVTALTLELRTGLLEVDGCRVRPVVVWVRHGSTDAMLAQAQPAGSLTVLDAMSWYRLLEQVTASACAALPGGIFVGPGQLVDARRLGFRAPGTVVTTDVAAGAALLGTPKVIVKTPDFRLFAADRSTWPAYLPQIVEAFVSAEEIAGDAVRERQIANDELFARAPVATLSVAAGQDPVSLPRRLTQDSQAEVV